MKEWIAIVLCCAQFLNAGCASIIRGKRQNVTVDTNPQGAIVSIGGSHEQMITPAELQLKRKGEYELEISKPGYKTQYVQIDRHLNGWFWGNFLFGGIIGIVVDLVTGAGYKLEPKEVLVELQPQSGVSR